MRGGSRNSPVSLLSQRLAGLQASARRQPETSPSFRPARAGRKDGLWLAAAAATGGGRRQRIVTGTGWEAIPFAITTRLLAPAGVPAGMVNWVDEAAPGATETELQFFVRA